MHVEKPLVVIEALRVLCNLSQTNQGKQLFKFGISSRILKCLIDHEEKEIVLGGLRVLWNLNEALSHEEILELQNEWSLDSDVMHLIGVFQGKK